MKDKYSLVLLEVSEADKWQLVAHKGSGWSKGLSISFIFLYVVKVSGVYVTVQLWHNWGHSWTTEAERGREREREKVIERKGARRRCNTRRG